MKNNKQWQKEKKQLLENQNKVEKKALNADDDVKFIKEKLDGTKKELEQARKEKEEALANLKKEREQIAGNASKEQLPVFNYQIKGQDHVWPSISVQGSLSRF